MFPIENSYAQVCCWVDENVPIFKTNSQSMELFGTMYSVFLQPNAHDALLGQMFQSSLIHGMETKGLALK